MKAVKIIELGKAELVNDVPIPKLRPDYVLIKVEAVALNPTDWKHVHYLAVPGVTVGVDLAGTIVEVGPEVTLPFAKGDRVASFVHGGNAVELEDGAFSEYAVAKGDIVWKIPSHMSFEEAATLNLATVTNGQALYQSLGLNLPTEPITEPEWVLIYGGSTGMGTMGIQLAKLSGYKVATLCGEHNFDLVKSYGADAVFDYKSPDVGAQIRQFTDNKLYYAHDCIAEKGATQICCDALSTDTAERKPIYNSLLFLQQLPRDDVEKKSVLAYTVTGEAFPFGPMKFPANPADFEFGKKFMPIAQKLFEEKKIKTHPIQHLSGGFEGVLTGMDDMKAGKVSGKKLVALVSETP